MLGRLEKHKWVLKEFKREQLQNPSQGLQLNAPSAPFSEMLQEVDDILAALSLPSEPAPKPQEHKDLGERTQIESKAREAASKLSGQIQQYCPSRRSYVHAPRRGEKSADTDMDNISLILGLYFPVNLDGQKVGTPSEKIICPFTGAKVLPEDNRFVLSCGLHASIPGIMSAVEKAKQPSLQVRISDSGGVFKLERDVSSTSIDEPIITIDRQHAPPLMFIYRW